MLKKKILIGLIAISIFCIIFAGVTRGADDWVMFHHDVAHTGYSTSNPSGGAKLWSFTTGGYVYSSSPAVVGGVVYIGSYDGNVYALDASSGAKLWNYTTGAGVELSSPAVVGGVVYIGSLDQNVYALSATNGAKLWSYTTGGYVVSSPAVVGGVVYVGSFDGFGVGNVYALDAVSGAKLWSYTTGGPILSSPAVVGGVVYIGSYDGNVYALDAVSGAGTTYTITVTQTTNGTISPGTTTVAQNGSQAFSVTPDSGYYIASITVDDGSVTVTSPAGQMVDFSNVQADHSITATFAIFAINTYTITVTQGTNGQISPGTTTVAQNGSQAFSVTPDSGYYIVSITVDNDYNNSVAVTSPLGQTVSFTDVAADHMLTATYAPYAPTTTTIIGIESNTTIVPITLGGNITAQQMTDVTITQYPLATTTTVSFTVTGTSGTVGSSNMTIPKTAIPYGTTPLIYIDGTLAPDQGYTEDATNFYVWYTTHFSTHQVTIQFATYFYSGILQPINADGSSIFKMKSTVPVKFQLRDSVGNLISYAKAEIYLSKISNGVLGTAQEATSTDAATSGNLFRYSDNQYVFNLGTKSLSVGTWQIRIALDDGTSKYVIISLK